MSDTLDRLAPAVDQPTTDAAAAVPTGMFASLRSRNYRLFASGQVVSLAGTWMQRVAQDWLVLELSGGSAVALGVAATLQFAPMLLLSLWGGMLADRYDKRRILLVVQLGLGMCALVLGLLDVTGIVTLWQVFAICLVLGCFSAVDVPVRQSFVAEMVGPERLPNAVALNSMTFNVARIAGPAVAGVLIAAIGTGGVFLINALSFAAVLAGLLLMNPDQLHRSPPTPRQPGQLRAGLHYVRQRPELMAVLALVFFVSTFGITFYLTLALLARNEFGLGADAYGWLTTFLAVGSLLGATLAAKRSKRPQWRLVAWSAFAFGVLETAAGLMPNFATTAVMLVLVGVAVLTFTTAANSTVQLSVDRSMRGRVMGLYLLLFLGGTPLGAPLLGVVAETFGARAPIVAGGAISAVSVLAVALLLRRSKGTLLVQRG
jgi:MFS family permease